MISFKVDVLGGGVCVVSGSTICVGNSAGIRKIVDNKLFGSRVKWVRVVPCEVDA